MNTGPLPTSKLPTINSFIAQKMCTGHLPTEDKLSHIVPNSANHHNDIVLLVLYVLIGNMQKICLNDKYTLIENFYSGLICFSSLISKVQK